MHSRIRPGLASLVFAVVFALALIAPLAAQPPTPDGAVSVAAIAADTTWGPEGSPYTITQLLTVAPGATLTIAPGVEVRFGPGAGLLIQGQLLAEGSAAAPILLTGTGATPGSWRGVAVTGTSSAPAGASLRHITLAYGGLASLGGANLALEQARASVAHATFRDSAGHGIFTGQGGGVDIADSTFTSNAGFALRLTDVGQSAALARLSAAGNGTDAIGIAGGGDLFAHDTWEQAGLPYLVHGTVGVRQGVTLTVEAGTTVRFTANSGLSLAGSLRALGTPVAPISFTGTAQTPGFWRGITFFGTTAAPTSGVFEHVTVEYGGSAGANGGNISVTNGQVLISDSTIRGSDDSGLVIASGASGSVIQRSKIVDNASFGLYTPTASPWQAVMAVNNWWGHPTGPTIEGACNPGGQGARVSKNVLVQPFLTSADGDMPAFTAAEGYQISLTPRRWFAPADGSSRLFVTITLRDGAGRPVAGKTVLLKSSLGTVVDGGVTDVEGKTFAYVTSSAAGEATLTPLIDLANGCSFARGATSEVTFLTPDDSQLLGDAAAPYMTEAIQIDPMPITRGVPTRLRATLTNPNDVPLIVEGTFAYAQAGLGLAFGPIGTATITIPPRSSGTVEIIWTPAVSGNYCVQFEYVASRADGADGAELSQRRMRRFQRNVHVGGGNFLPKSRRDVLKDTKVAIDALDDADFLYATLDSYKFSGAIPALVQDQLLGNLLDFIQENGGAIDCALGGGASCGGWKGPKLKLPGDSIGNLLEDPPSQRYRELYTVEPTALPPIAAPDPRVPPARAAAFLELGAALLELHDYMFAAAVSHDRYNGAMQANELAWASKQAGAYMFYLYKTGLAFKRTADAYDAVVAAIKAEGHATLPANPALYREHQQRLATSGFTAIEREAAFIAGLTPEALEYIRQQRLARNPDTMPADLLAAWTELASKLRAAGEAVLEPPAYGQGSVGGVGSRVAAAVADHNLVWVTETSATVQVGNPTAERATVELRVRPVDLPPGWVVVLDQPSVTLDPGEHVPVTVTFTPGAAAVQGTRARVALEGSIGGELIGGIAVDVVASVRADFDGKLRLYLPLIRH